MLAVRIREQHIDELAAELTEAVTAHLVEGRTVLHDFYEAIVKIEPHRLLGRWAVTLGELQSRGRAGLQKRLNAAHMALTAQEGRLAGLDPRSVLQRGYSITRNKQSGRVVRTLDDIQTGQNMVTELAAGARIESKVTGKPERQERSE
jgi:exodeoxyribonuclease VII large subunit